MESILYQCKICQKSFSGPIPLTQHLDSNHHKKKVEQSSAASIDPTRTDTSIEKQVTSFSFCDICKMSFSGPIPYSQHIDGTPHKKKLENLRKLKELNTTGGASGNSSNSNSIITISSCGDQFDEPKVEDDDHANSPVPSSTSENWEVVGDVEKPPKLIQSCSICKLKDGFTNVQDLQEHYNSIEHAKNCILIHLAERLKLASASWADIPDANLLEVFKHGKRK